MGVCLLVRGAKGVRGVRNLSVSASSRDKHHCKLLVVGGGAGGCTVASKFSRRLGKNAVIVLEPAESHYYQPLYTLVGAGVTKLKDCRKKSKDVLPKGAKWIQDAVERIDPHNDLVRTKCGHEINYEYLVVALGLKFDYDKVPGLKDALDRPDSRVSTIYSPDYCEKVYRDLQVVSKGDVIFTYPAGPVKCPGAPQKICYLADAFFRKNNIRSKVNITYNSCLPVIFGVKKYADALWRVVEDRGIHVNLQTVLKEVDSDNKEAVFASVGDKGKSMRVKYDMLHTVPPMSTADCLAGNKDLSDGNGFLDVDKYTLQHNKYRNVYGIGDCTNTPNSKTAAAVACQSWVLEQNLVKTMAKDAPNEKYNGYGACPLVTSYNTCIMAEFDYNLTPLETLPFNQAKERTITYYMKKDLFPFLYWNLMLKGYWHGPSAIRRIVNPFANP